MRARDKLVVWCHGGLSATLFTGAPLLNEDMTHSIGRKQKVLHQFGEGYFFACLCRTIHAHQKRRPRYFQRFGYFEKRVRGELLEMTSQGGAQLVRNELACASVLGSPEPRVRARFALARTRVEAQLDTDLGLCSCGWEKLIGDATRRVPSLLP